MKKTALVTGASSGIGLEFARIFAKNGYSLLVVARKEAELQKVATDLRQSYGVEVHVFAADLSEPASPKSIFDFCESRSLQVDVLVNNAGVGTFGKFAETDLQRQMRMLDLNVRSLTLLTGLFLPAMVQRKQGKVLNVASTAAFQPGPFMAVYYASKSFVLSFSQAINNELKGTGVSATVLCPGPTRTNFENLSEDFADSKLMKLGLFVPAEKVAEIGYRALMRGKPVAVPGFKNNLMVFSTRFSPPGMLIAISRWILEKN